MAPHLTRRISEAESTQGHCGETVWWRAWASLTQSHFEELPLAGRAGRCANLDSTMHAKPRAREGHAGRVGAPKQELGEPGGVVWA